MVCELIGHPLQSAFAFIVSSRNVPEDLALDSVTAQACPPCCQSHYYFRSGQDGRAWNASAGPGTRCSPDAVLHVQRVRQCSHFFLSHLISSDQNWSSVDLSILWKSAKKCTLHQIQNRQKKYLYPYSPLQKYQTQFRNLEIIHWRFHSSLLRYRNSPPIWSMNLYLFYKPQHQQKRLWIQFPHCHKH